MTTISTGHHNLQISNLGPPNPLPVFRWQQPIALQEAPPSKKLSPEEVKNSFVWGSNSILPYQVQDSYDRSRQPGRLPAVFVENQFLKLTIYPQYGGRLASIFNKQTQRELLFRNPVFQPANLAILNAWFSGGIEWNGLIPGHTPFTCSPVFTATVETGRGPLLRLYEFDRIREATWQVDLYLPPDEAKLWVHVKIINPNSHPTNCYWWTNIATPLEKKTRVLSPAEYGLEHVLPDNHLESFPFPHAHGFDGSYPANYPDAASVFFRKPGQKRPWIATFQKDGQGMFHTSTRELLARKLFVFGHKSGGRRWMDFLALPGQGNYIEIQGGVVPTQNQEFILEANQSIEWTECIAPLSINPNQGHDPDYQAACRALETWVTTQVPEERLNQVDTWLRNQAGQPVGEILQPGSAWGMLFEKMTGIQINAGLRFNTSPAAEALWAELLEAGTFSEQTLSQSPQSWAVSGRWVAALENSCAVYGTTWLHELFLGVARLDRLNIKQARCHFEESNRLKENYLSNRNLALIHQQDGDVAAAQRFYFKAWDQADHSTHLAVEICQFLQKERLLPALELFLAHLPDSILRHERIQLAQGELALEHNQFEKLREILDGDFCTIREGETLLTDLWFALHIKKAEVGKRTGLSEHERAKIIAQNPPLHKIDFRMVSE